MQKIRCRPKKWKKNNLPPTSMKCFAARPERGAATVVHHFTSITICNKHKH